MPAKAPEDSPGDQLRVTHGCLGCAAPMGTNAALPIILTAGAAPWRLPTDQLAALDQRPDTPPPRA